MERILWTCAGDPALSDADAKMSLTIFVECTLAVYADGSMFHCWGGPAMKFTVDHDDNVVIFTLKESRLDSSNAPDVKAELLIVCQPTISALVVDLSRVDYADSSGLSALLLAYRQLRDHNIPIALVGVRETVRNLFRISQMEWLFGFYPTVEAALQELQTQSSS